MLIKLFSVLSKMGSEFMIRMERETTAKAEKTAKKFSPFSVDSLLATKVKKQQQEEVVSENNNEKVPVDLSLKKGM